MIIYKKSFLGAVFLSLLFLPMFFAQAVCPVCVVAIAGGLGIFEWLGIDDTVGGIWVGGLTLSLILWTINYFRVKKWSFPQSSLIITLAYILLIIVPLFFLGFIGLPNNILWGLDKLLLGIIIGFVATLLASAAYLRLKKSNHNRAHFPFQKVAMPVATLLLLSLVFYLITR